MNTKIMRCAYADCRSTKSKIWYEHDRAMFCEKCHEEIQRQDKKWKILEPVCTHCGNEEDLNYCFLSNKNKVTDTITLCEECLKHDYYITGNRHDVYVVTKK